MKRRVSVLFIALLLLFSQVGCGQSDLPSMPDIAIQTEQDAKNVIEAMGDGEEALPTAPVGEQPPGAGLAVQPQPDNPQRHDLIPEQGEDEEANEPKDNLRPGGDAFGVFDDNITLRPSEKVFSKEYDFEVISPFAVGDAVLNSFRAQNPPAVLTDRNEVTISIGCQTAIDNGVNEKAGFTHLPRDGWILQPIVVEFSPGETVFEVLAKAVIDRGIHMEYSGMKPLQYIKGIDNLYEYDGGRWSGWMYSVNGSYPNFGCGQMVVEPGDLIQWNYTCDLGADLGQSWLGQGAAN